MDDAIEALRQFEGSREAVATVYLYNVAYKLVGRRAAREDRRLAALDPRCRSSAEPPVTCTADTPDDDVAALFDKYNLVTLAVLDEHERLAGIITADDVITMLRHRR